MKIVFKINDYRILEMSIDISSKEARVDYCKDELSVKPILDRHERTYTGLEKRLQFMMDNQQSLVDNLADIKHNGTQIPFQRNLNIEIKE